MMCVRCAEFLREIEKARELRHRVTKAERAIAEEFDDMFQEIARGAKAIRLSPARYSRLKELGNDQHAALVEIGVRADRMIDEALTVATLWGVRIEIEATA